MSVHDKVFSDHAFPVGWNPACLKFHAKFVVNLKVIVDSGGLLQVFKFIPTVNNIVLSMVNNK